MGNEQWSFFGVGATLAMGTDRRNESNEVRRRHPKANYSIAHQGGPGVIGATGDLRATNVHPAVTALPPPLCVGVGGQELQVGGWSGGREPHTTGANIRRGYRYLNMRVCV